MIGMVAAPYPLWIVWDETDSTERQTYYARVIGWQDPTEHQIVRSRPGSPLPVVIHPETQLPVTLGHDGPASVSRMEDYDDLLVAVARWESRRRAHRGAQ